MGSVVSALVFKNGTSKIAGERIPKDLFSLEVKDIDGKTDKLSYYTENRKATLFVNVASKWGLTDVNYRELVEIDNIYRSKGLEILGFPCRQFGGQEFEKEEDIKNFIKQYNVEFPMFSLIEVNGKNTHPVYLYLKANTEEFVSKDGLKDIAWNFGKFLVNSEGKIAHYYGPKTNPKSFISDIEKML